MDAYGLRGGNVIELSGAEQAFTQSVLKGDIVAWCGSPREYWPPCWTGGG